MIPGSDVWPPAGKRVLILNGPYRDTEALLEGIDEKKFSATLTLDSVGSPLPHPELDHGHVFHRQ